MMMLPQHGTDGNVVMTPMKVPLPKGEAPFDLNALLSTPAVGMQPSLGVVGQSAPMNLMSSVVGESEVYVAQKVAVAKSVPSISVQASSTTTRRPMSAARPSLAAVPALQDTLQTLQMSPMGAVPMDQGSGIFKCTFSCTGLDAKDTNGLSDSYFTLTRLDPEAADGTVKLLWKSETIKKSLNPVFAPFDLPEDAFKDGPITVSLTDWDRFTKDDLIGSVVINGLNSGAPQQWGLINPKKVGTDGYVDSGMLTTSVERGDDEDMKL